MVYSMNKKGRSKRAKASKTKVKTFRTKQGLLGASKTMKSKKTTWSIFIVPYRTKTGKIRRKTIETTYSK